MLITLQFCVGSATFSNRINILHVSYFKKYNFNYWPFSTQAAIFDVLWISHTIS